MRTPRITGRKFAIVGTALALTATAACSGSREGGGNSGGSGEAAGSDCATQQVDALVHTDAGGGADLLARELIAMMEDEEIIEPGTWTVDNREGGGSAVALGYLQEQSGRDDIVAFSSNVYVVNRLVTEGVEVGYGSFTPIVALYNDSMAAAVAADGPYKSLQDFIDAAKAAPGTLVQAGGSQTATDALAGEFLQRESGAEWQFLSFPGGGERKTALLRGDAGLYLTEPADMLENVEAGEMIPVAIVGEERVDLMPDVPTTVELGYDDLPPAQTRGIVGPPDMPEEAVTCYAGLFEQLTETASYQEFIERSAAVPNFLVGAEFDAYLAELEQTHIELFRETGQLVNE
ncbi:MAG: tripartite tricarboxylate transporter substrate binding protein [Actinomycetota bacterium]|nr:tripartite tricarboxylate transporter substrate binding protein [Actinomycetota bacterium]